MIPIGVHQIYHPQHYCQLDTTCKDKNQIPHEINIRIKVLVPLVKAKQGISNYHLCMLVFHFIKLTTSIHHTSMYIKFKLDKCKQAYVNAHSNASNKFISLLPLLVCSNFNDPFCLSKLPLSLIFPPCHLSLIFPLVILSYLCDLFLLLQHQ